MIAGLVQWKSLPASLRVAAAASVRMSDIFAGPPLDAAQRQLTSALLMSLLAGVGGLWAASLTTLRRARS